MGVVGAVSLLCTIRPDLWVECLSFSFALYVVFLVGDAVAPENVAGVLTQAPAKVVPLKK